MWFKIIGTTGVWDKTELKNQKQNKEIKFLSGSLVEIELEGPFIGDLKIIKIWV